MPIRKADPGATAARSSRIRTGEKKAETHVDTRVSGQGSAA
jgi:hypothetical protein